MRITFLGAAGTVTGSKYLLENSHTKLLIDCGLFQGLKELRLRNWEEFPIDPKTIESVILTHAHLDHSGYLPLLVKQGFSGKIYGSKATNSLVEILLLDAGKIQEEDAYKANRDGFSKHHPALPLYTVEDVKKTLKLLKDIPYNAPQSLRDDINFTFSPSGHILGSSFVLLKHSSQSILFSGDLGRANDPIMNKPDRFKAADYLILESTYGNRLHNRIDVLDHLEEIITTTLAKKGTVVIPSFAVGRAQTILYYLYLLKKEHRIPQEIPIYVDSPMAEDVTNLWNSYPNEHKLPREEVAKICASARYVQSAQESYNLHNNPSSKIIISASGMAEGGRVLSHIAFYGPDPINTILFVGFQAEGTRGYRILHNEPEVKIYGRMIPIRARVENLDALSSHADYEELLDWLKTFEKPPKEIFLTHGEVEAAKALKERIEKAFNWKVTIPKYLDSFNLT